MTTRQQFKIFYCKVQVADGKYKDVTILIIENLKAHVLNKNKRISYYVSENRQLV